MAVLNLRGAARRLRCRLARALLPAWAPALAGALALALLPAATAPLRAQPLLTEAQAKAGFVLNFARYVEWPAGAFAARETPVQACVLAREPVAAALAALEGKPVQGRPLRVRRLAGTADELRGCHLVFFSEQEDRRVVPLLRAAEGHPVLTIGDGDLFIDQGGAIGLVQGDGRLQFEINRGALERAQLKAGAALLRLARNAS